MTETERISWVLHNKKQILFEDYSGLNGKEMLAVLHASNEIFDSLREPVPVLLDFNGATMSNEFMNEFMRRGKQYGALIRKGASIGVNGPKKALLMMYFTYTRQEHRSKICETTPEALDYLVAPQGSKAVETVN
jgi:hypothetical protein